MSLPRKSRLLDLVGMLLFLVGVGLYAWAWVGLAGVPDFVPDPADPPFATVRHANGLMRVQRAGWGFMGAGMAVFVGAWWVGRRVLQRAP
ncbi:MAG: hypothetical protein RQ751_09165 [Longimicrobiales bacterium]|nr:hypothetical protein [Longimicrobiales bacterium]